MKAPQAVSIALFASALFGVIIWLCGLFGLEAPPPDVQEKFIYILIIVIAWLIYDRKIDGKVNLGPNVPRADDDTLASGPKL